MAYRNDFYIQKPEGLIYLASCVGSDPGDTVYARTESEFRKLVYHRCTDDSSGVSDGTIWPWPWMTSKLSDDIYIFREDAKKWYQFWKKPGAGKVWAKLLCTANLGIPETQCYIRRWDRVMEGWNTQDGCDDPDTTPTDDLLSLPEMGHIPKCAVGPYPHKMDYNRIFTNDYVIV